jgi:hypothetical protein
MVQFPYREFCSRTWHVSLAVVSSAYTTRTCEQRCLQHAQHANVSSTELPDVRARWHQQQFPLNIWAGIVGDHFIGPHMLPTRMNDCQYLLYLQQELPALLEDIPTHLQQCMWIQLDGAPPQYL